MEGGHMHMPSWRSWRVIGTVAVLAIVSTACLGGGNKGSNPPGQSITPKTAVDPTSPVTITFSSWVGDSPQMQGFVKDFEKLHPNIKNHSLHRFLGEPHKQKTYRVGARNNTPT